jgi:hypothetical protein
MRHQPDVTRQAAPAFPTVTSIRSAVPDPTNANDDLGYHNRARRRPPDEWREARDVSQLTVAFRGSRSLSSSGPLYHEAALSTSSSEWPVYRPARPTRERLRAGSCRLGPRSRCCVSLEQAARDSRSGCPSSICRSQERSRHRHGPRRLSRCGVVARYEREDPFATTTADDQAGPRDSVAFIGRARRRGSLPGRVTVDGE